MPMQLFSSPPPHIPLSHSRQNHIPVSHLSHLAEANTLHRSSLFPLWPDHPLKPYSPSPGPSCWYTSLPDNPVHVQSSPDCNDPPLGHGRLDHVTQLPRCCISSPTDGQKTTGTMGTFQPCCPLQHCMFLSFDMHVVRHGPLPVDLTPSPLNVEGRWIESLCMVCVYFCACVLYG